MLLHISLIHILWVPQYIVITLAFTIQLIYKDSKKRKKKIHFILFCNFQIKIMENHFPPLSAPLPPPPKKKPLIFKSLLWSRPSKRLCSAYIRGHRLTIKKRTMYLCDTLCLSCGLHLLRWTLPSCYRIIPVALRDTVQNLSALHAEKDTEVQSD